MHKVLYTSLSLNGQVLVQENRSTPPPMEVITNFIDHVREAGNMIMGRTSAQSLLMNPAALEMFGPVRIVVLSHHLQDGDNYVVARSPEEALEHLSAQGFDHAFIAGGAKVYNAFLTKDLADELIINISPEITTNGISLVSRENFTVNYGLVASRALTRDITQLQYRKQQ
jgi:dihydrofolate reductase